MLASVKSPAARFLRGGHRKHPRRAWRLWRAERIGREARRGAGGVNLGVPHRTEGE